MPGNRKPTSEDWSGYDKLAVVLETASMTAQELSEYCRSKGLYPEQIEAKPMQVLSILGIVTQC